MEAVNLWFHGGLTLTRTHMEMAFCFGDATMFGGSKGTPKGKPPLSGAGPFFGMTIFGGSKGKPSNKSVPLKRQTHIGMFDPNTPTVSFWFHMRASKLLKGIHSAPCGLLARISALRRPLYS